MVFKRCVVSGGRVRCQGQEKNFKIVMPKKIFLIFKYEKAPNWLTTQKQTNAQLFHLHTPPKNLKKKMSAADPTTPLRFKVGTRVECNTGSWTPGAVVQIYYSEPHWPAGRIVPYQVKLDDGRLIFAPMDDDRVIREVPKTPLHDALDNFDVELLRELCGGAAASGGGAAGGGDAAPSIFLNRPNFKGEPPIIYLLSSEKFEDVDDEKQELVLQMAAVLKDSGCALGTCNMQGSNVLHCAAVRGSVKLMRLVLEWQKEPKYALSLDEQNMEGECVPKMLFLVSTMKLFILVNLTDIHFFSMDTLFSTFILNRF